MIEGIGEQPIAADEWLARFILRREHVRADGSVKPDPFMPYRWVELSLTRHLGLDESEVWAAGEDVAEETRTQLEGRADVQAHLFTRQRLRVLPRPLPHNPELRDWRRPIRHDHWLHKTPRASGGIVLIQPLRPAVPCAAKHRSA